jgi:hypothetical protein
MDFSEGVRLEHATSPNACPTGDRAMVNAARTCRWFGEIKLGDSHPTNADIFRTSARVAVDDHSCVRVGVSVRKPSWD